AGLRVGLRARTTAEERAVELAEDATRALSPADLATDEAARAAVLPAEERTRLQKLVQTRAVDESRLSDGLAEEGIAETTATEEARRQAEAHVAETATEHAAARTAAQEAAGLAARQRGIAERGDAARTALETASARERSVSEDAGVLLRVADLATGR